MNPFLRVELAEAEGLRLSQSQWPVATKHIEIRMPLIPLVMDAFGALHHDTINVLQRVGKIKARILGQDYGTVLNHLYQQLSVILARSSGEMILSSTGTYCDDERNIGGGYDLY